MDDYVPIADIAEWIGLDRSNARKYILKHGFKPLLIRTSRSRGQPTLALPREDAEAVRALRESQGFGTMSKPTAKGGRGWFYVVQLVPDLDPNRVKLGFTTSVDERLAAHRTAAPTAVLSKAWPCDAAWEAAAIASATRIGCRHIANEVYQCDDLAGLIERADAFFAVMPQRE